MEVVSVKVISSKIPHPIIYCLIILLVIIVIYLIYPKYQIISNSGNIYKLNRITGQITNTFTKITFPKIPKGFAKKPSGKILVSPDSPAGKFLQSIKETPEKP